MINKYLRHVVLLLILSAIWGCSEKVESKEKSVKPAEVQNAVKETDLTTITLTPEAVTRLGIQTAPVEDRILERTRKFGGEVSAIPGHSVTVTAPLSGTLLVPDDEFILSAGKQITKGQTLYRLLLALPEKDLLSIQEEAELRRVELELAQTKVRRAQQLLEDKAGSVRQLEEAQAELAGAQAALRIAETRMKLLQSGRLDLPVDELPSLLIKSPIEGIMQKVYTSVGQTVTNSAALVEITNFDPIWIRVPVYVGNLEDIDIEKPAQVHSLSDSAGIETLSAISVEAPLSANSQASTVDLFYELTNAEAAYRPGQKVGVRLALKDLTNSLVVPYASILYDMYGSAWVYENTATQVYVRRRVKVDHVLGEFAVLTRGPEVGAQVVTAGAAELFGTEFEVGK